MKKTIFFARKHIAKDKIISFVVDSRCEWGASAIINLVDRSSEEERFSVEGFDKLFEVFNIPDFRKSLPWPKKTSEEIEEERKNTIRFALEFFKIPLGELEETDPSVKEKIKVAYDELLKDLTKKAEERIAEVIKEYEEE